MVHRAAASWTIWPKSLVIKQMTWSRHCLKKQGHLEQQQGTWSLNNLMPTTVTAWQGDRIWEKPQHGKRIKQTSCKNTTFFRRILQRRMQWRGSDRTSFWLANHENRIAWWLQKKTIRRCCQRLNSGISRQIVPKTGDQQADHTIKPYPANAERWAKQSEAAKIGKMKTSRWPSFAVFLKQLGVNTIRQMETAPLKSYFIPAVDWGKT